MLRRIAPILVLSAAAALVLSYVVYSAKVLSMLREHTERSSATYARIYTALADTTSTDGLAALFELSGLVAETGVPIIATDADGVPRACINLPYCDPLDPEKAAAFVARLDRETTPLPLTGGQILHFGYSDLVRWLRIIPFIQAGALVLILLAGVVLIRERGHWQREKLWSGMARETAHQLATPISSLSGWLELLGDEKSLPRAQQHMRADVERLERVAHRFERIGRPAKREDINVFALATRVVEYFQPRLPRLGARVHIAAIRPESEAIVQGDPVLLEWALESLVKNAIDAVAGKEEGKIEVSVTAEPEGIVRIRVQDDGPGVSRELQASIFRPGFTTKERGWGIGLALTRRIVEENHGGQLSLIPSTSGAIFEILIS